MPAVSSKSKNQNPEFELPDDWRGKVMTRVRQLFAKADPEIVEEVKYKTASNPNGVLVWYCNGMISTGEVYKKHLRLSFSQGPELKKHDKTGLINSYRAVLINEGDELNEDAFVDLVREAVRLNKKI